MICWERGNNKRTHWKLQPEGTKLVHRIQTLYPNTAIDWLKSMLCSWVGGLSIKIPTPPKFNLLQSKLKNQQGFLN